MFTADQQIMFDSHFPDTPILLSIARERTVTMTKMDWFILTMGEVLVLAIVFVFA